MNVFEIIFKVAIFVGEVIGLFKLYGKMGEKQWAALIPFYDEFAIFRAVYTVKAFWIYTVFDLVSSVLLAFDSFAVSIIGLVLAIVVLVIQIRFAKYFAAAFGKGKGFAVLTFLFPAAIYIYAGYSDKVQYVGNPNK